MYNLGFCQKPSTAVSAAILKPYLHWDYLIPPKFLVGFRRIKLYYDYKIMKN